MTCGEKAFVTRQGLQLGLMMATQSSPGRHEGIISTAPGCQDLLAVTSFSVSKTHSATR